jgi:predicted CopG family antitoxin
MATKTITIDLEAYSRLKSVQAENESFSQTIRRTIQPRLDLDAYLNRLEAASLSPAAARAVRAHVVTRHRPAHRMR